MKIYFLLATLLSAPLYAQNAKVIALSPADAKDARYLYEQRDAINQRIADFQKSVTEKYLMEDKPGPDPFSFGIMFASPCYAGGYYGDGHIVPCPPPTQTEKAAAAAEEEKRKKQHHLERMPGWDGFEFSNDFKFIVPVKPEIRINNYGMGGGCGMFTGSYVNPVSFSSVTLSKQ